MRILSVGSIPPEWGGATRGGVATFHRVFVETAARQMDVSLISANWEGPSVPPYILHRPPTDRTEEQAWFVDLANSFDVVVLQHVANRFGIWAACNAMPPTVGVLHSWYALTGLRGEQRQRMYERLEEALAGCDVVVFPSEFSRTDGVALGFSYPESIVIHHPLPVEFTRPVDIFKSREGVVFVGAFTDHKRPADVIAAAARLGISVVLIGEGPQMGYLQELSTELGADATFLGSLPGSRVRDVVAQAEVLCVPSRSESFGIVYTEALACGTPVVGYPPSMAEIGAAMGTRVGAPADPDIVSALGEVLSTEWDRSLLRDRALKAFSVERTVGRHVEMIEALA